MGLDPTEPTTGRSLFKSIFPPCLLKEPITSGGSEAAPRPPGPLPKTPADAGRPSEPSPWGQQDTRPPSRKVLLFVTYKNKRPQPPWATCSAKVYAFGKRKKKDACKFSEQMGAKAVINPQQLGCLIFCQRVCSRLGGWLIWASAITLCLMRL